MLNDLNIDRTAPFTKEEEANLEKVFWGYFPIYGGNGNNRKAPHNPFITNGYTITYKQKDKTIEKYFTATNKRGRVLKTDEEIRDFITLSTVFNCPSYCGFLRAGFVTIDFDNKEEKSESFEKIEELIKNGIFPNIPIRKTDNGYHLDFKIPEGLQLKQDDNILLACGLRADIRPSHTGNGSYIVLKMNAKYRKYIQTVDEIPELPLIFYPIYKENKEHINLIGLQQGERNSTLFKYSSQLQRNYSFSEIQREEIANFISENIISAPIPQSEISSIFRENASSLEFDNNNFDDDNDEKDDDKFELEISDLEEKEKKELTKLLKLKGAKKYKKLAQYYIKTFHIIKTENTLYKYSNGIYKTFDFETEIKRYFQTISSFRQSQLNEIIANVDTFATPYDEEEDHENLIPFKNGYINLNEASSVDEIKTLQAHKYSPNDRFFFCLPFNWNPSVEFEENGKYKDFVDKFISDLSCGEEEYITKLFEIGAISLYRNNGEGIEKKAFFLTGKQANGKSTFINFLVFCFGKDNTTKLSPDELTDKFRQGNLYKKMLCYDSELGNVRFKAKPLKSAVTGDPLKHEEKFKKDFTFNPYCGFVYGCNSIPNNDDFGSAMERRLEIIEFNADFSKNSKVRDISFLSKIKNPKMAEYYYLRIVETLKKILLNGGKMSESKLSERDVTEYISSSSHVIGFIRQWKEDKEEEMIKDSSYNNKYPLQNVILGKLYNVEFSEYCIENNININAIPRRIFSKELCREENCKTDRKTINGKKETYFYYPQIKKTIEEPFDEENSPF